MDWVALSKSCKTHLLDEGLDVSSIHCFDQYLIVGQCSGQVMVFDVSTDNHFTLIQTFIAHKHSVSSIVCLPFEADGIVDLSIITLDESGYVEQLSLAEQQLSNSLFNLFLANIFSDYFVNGY